MNWIFIIFVFLHSSFRVPRSSFYCLLRRHDHLAELPAALQAFMRGGGVLQRKHGIHYWLELLLAEEGQDLQQIGLRAHERTEQRLLTAEEQSHVELHVRSGGGATGHQTSGLGHGSNALIPHRLTDMLK